MIEKLTELKSINPAYSEIYTPAFYRISNSEDKSQLEELINSTPNIKVFDQFRGQVEELIKCRNPKTDFKNENIDKFVEGYLGNNFMDAMGVWIYYPWSNQLVHSLDKDEFIEIRTNRNQYKITREETEILSRKKIGIAGLSVGQSIALTIALERICGEIVLADFDYLELSNLNRIESSISNLNIPKVINTARRIAELDPFIKVKCYTNGLQENNLDEFFLSGGPLDLFIEECDSLDIKILSREKAREYGIPVLMEMNDRCTIDIERFDLDKKRPLLHGFIEGLNSSKIKGLSTEEKVPYILPMLGENTISDKLKASIMEINQTITGWPQLGSCVMLGGAVVTNVARRVLLNQFKKSGRYFIDLDQLIHNTDEQVDIPGYFETINENENGSVKKLEFSPVSGNGIHIPKDHINQIISAAIKAPTAGNYQPWIWRYNNGQIDLYFDKSRSSTFLDLNYWSSYIGFGAAIENIIIQAGKLGYLVQVNDNFNISDPDLIASLYLMEDKNNEASKVENGLSEFIENRGTNRNIEKRVEIEGEKLNHLSNVVKQFLGANLNLVTDLEQIRVLSKIIGAADRITITSKDGHEQFMEELRWTDKENELKKDGLDIDTFDLTPTERAGIRMAKSWSVVKHLNGWGGGKVFEKLSRKGVENSSAIGFLTMDKSESVDYFNGGRAMQRLWLECDRMGISVQPHVPSLFLFARLIKENGKGLSKENKEELNKLRNEFKEVFKIDDSLGEIFLFRLFLGKRSFKKSIRRPVDEVLFFD